MGLNVVLDVVNMNKTSACIAAVEFPSSRFVGFAFVPNAQIFNLIHLDS